MKANLDLTNIDIKKQIINIFEDITDIEEHRSYLEISLPIFLDDSYRINLYLDKKQNILYNNLYTVLENSICEKLGKQRDIVKEYLYNEKEFSEIKNTLLKFGINSNSLTLEYKLDEEDIAKQILIYSEMVKKYYNNLYNIILYRLTSSKHKKHIYYNSFEKIIEEFKGKKSFKKINYEGISGTPIYSNESMTVAASKDFDALTQFYIDLEETTKFFKGKKGIVFCNNYKENHKKTKVLKNKIENKNIQLVFFEDMNDENELRKKIKDNLKICGED